MRPILLVLSLACACGASESTGLPGPPPPPPVATITVSGTDSVFYAGSGQLTAILRDSLGAVLTGRLLTWSSSNPGTIAVDGTGHLDYVGPGTSQIVAMSEGISGARQVTAVGLTFVDVSVGQLFSCGLSSRGQAFCWGAYRSGPAVFAPSLISFPAPLVALAVGQQLGGTPYACGVSANGTAYCSTPPSNAAPLGGGVSLTRLSLGAAHACGLTQLDAAYCWGYNNLGQLGTESPPMDHALPTIVSGGLTFVELAAGVNHTCAVETDMSAYCWGSNGNGQLGGPSLGRADAPTAVAGGLQFLAIAAGADHSCAIAVDSTPYCWGKGAQGQLGTNSLASVSAPAAVFGGLHVSRLALGLFHTCAITGSGVALCWGMNTSGQLGDGTTAQDSVPRATVGGHAFIRISAGLGHTCALSTALAIYCWGDNQFGQLGTAGPAASSVPVKVSGQP